MTQITEPNYTQVPNIVFDYWMNILTPAEFKVLLCLCRKTFGWHKKTDKISLKQIEDMTGLSRKGITTNLKTLLENDLIKKIQSKTYDGDFAANKYEINVNSVRKGSELSTPQVVNSAHHRSELSTPTKETSTKERLTKRNSSDSQSSSEQPADFSFSSFSGEFEGITPKDLEDWKVAFPHIEINQELIKAQQWLKSNPSKAKKKLWRKFLIGWFSRACDKAENQAAYRSTFHSTEQVDENIAYAKKRVENFSTIICEQRHCRIDFLGNQLEIIPNSANMPPTVIRFDEKGFKEQLENALRKWGLK